MKQVFFDGKGQLMVQDIPVPVPPADGALVRTEVSLISTGTELVQATGGGSLIRKALAQPELIRRAFELTLREGIAFTAGQVQEIAQTWFASGYSSAGTVIEPGSVSPFRAGDRAACAGAGIANHAEYNAIPTNLMTAIPDGVTAQQAAFANVGAIAMQGVRRAEPTLGETVVVVGLGLIGQITAQILAANGCRVIGVDLREDRRALAAQLAGADPVDPAQGSAAKAVQALTGGIGADRVILCAATDSSAPTNEAFRMCRERGRVVMVGAMGMDLDRNEMYVRELDFVISRSGGPGRYDRNYEERGISYPVGYVRWTETRNMAAVLDLIARGRLNVDALVAGTYPVEQAAKAYEAASSGALAVLITYPNDGDPSNKEPAHVLRRAVNPEKNKLGLALVGAGSFARAVHLPNILKHPDLAVTAVVSGSASAAQVADKVGAGLATTRIEDALNDPGVDAVLITTRHHLHYEQARAALAAGKHVFIEKPMTLTVPHAEELLQLAATHERLITVGFNRRMAPTAIELKNVLRRVGGPATLSFRVNAGAIPAAHWLNDLGEGGGRLLGEGVHFIDFLCGMVDADPVSISAQGSPDWQEFSVSITFADGSLGTVLYSARGSSMFPKERVEVFAGRGVAVLEDFKTLTFTDMPGRAIKGAGDKGHAALLDNFVAAIRGQADLGVTGADGLRATRLALAAMHSIQAGQGIDLRRWNGGTAHE